MHPIVCFGAGYATVVTARLTQKYIEERKAEPKQLDTSEDEPATEAVATQPKGIVRKLSVLTLSGLLIIPRFLKSSFTIVTTAASDEIKSIREEIEREDLAKNSSDSAEDATVVEEDAATFAAGAAENGDAAPAPA